MDATGRMKRIFWLCCWLCLTSWSIRAQSAQTIEIGSSVESDLTAGESQTWSFIARGTMILTIYAEQVSGDLDPVITLLDTNGNQLVSNDDVAYPDSHDALIQAFDLPGNGSYSIKVDAFGTTSGKYRLTLQSGYSQTSFADDFSTDTGWEIPETSLLIHTIVDGRMFLELEGIKQTGHITASKSPQVTDFYLHTDFSEISGRNGWRTGLIFRQQDENHYYRVVINDQGFWQMEVVDGETVTVIRDWGTHPVIVAGVPEFELGILANENAFDVFYNGQFIGMVLDDTYPDAGQIGISLATMDALNSDIHVTVDDLVLTEPHMVNNMPLFPEVLYETTNTNMVRTLERQQVIPQGGELKLTVGESFAQNVLPGVSRFSVGGSVQYTEFVMGATISWIIPGDGLGACGLVFNSTGNDTYSLAYLDKSGGFGVSQRKGDSFMPGIYGENLDPKLTSRDVILIVHNQKIHYYIDGKHVGSMDYTPTAGEIGIAVVNFDQVDTSCQFNNIWLWTLDNLASS